MKHLSSASILLILLALLPTACTTMSEGRQRFVDLGNGICHDTVSGQMWQINKSRTFASLNEAEEYVHTLRLGGYDDWRLPSVDEVYNLYFLFDLHQNGNCNLDRDGNFWTTGLDGGGMAGAWEISDQCDPEREFFKGRNGAVRAIRN